MQTFKPKSKQVTNNFTRRTSAPPILQQLSFLEADRATVTLAPASFHPHRYLITVKQGALHWVLLPSLQKVEAFDLLALFEQQQIDWTLDLNEGCPIEVVRIHEITERFIDGQLAGLGGAV